MNARRPRRTTLASYVLLAFLLSTGVSLAESPAEQMLDATCRVWTQNENGKWGRGSGVVYKEDKTHYWILSAGHLATAERKEIRVEFFYTGDSTGAMKVEIHKVLNGSAFADDLAIFKLAKSWFKGGRHPAICEIGGKVEEEFVSRAGPLLYTCGCPAGRWPSLQKARLQTGAGNILYWPVPVVGGQSGSPVCTEAGKVVGIIVRTNGICVGLKKIRAWLAED